MERDSLEDYIQLSRGRDELKKEENKVHSFIATTEKKRESEDRAIKIVELLMEGTVRPETFLKSILYLNPMYYQDIIEERALIKLCGYPLCGKKIHPTTNKRYSISTKYNKVYDLTEYGYFCSLFCYNANNHIKNQIDDSPLWLREVVEVPTLTLLPKEKGYASTGVDLKSKIENKEDANFTPIVSFAEMSLGDFINFEIEKTKNNKKQQFKLPTIVESQENTSAKSSAKPNKIRTSNINQLEPLVETIEEDISDCLKTTDFETEKNNNDELVKENLLVCKSNEVGKNDTVEVKRKVVINEPIKVSKHIADKHISSDQLKGIRKNIKHSSMEIIDPQPIQKNEDRSKNLLNMKDLKALNERIKNKFAKPVVKLISPLPLNVENTKVESINQSDRSISNSNKGQLKLQEISLLKLKFSVKNPEEIENQIKNVVKNWITLDTLIFVHGEDEIKKILTEKKLSEYFDNLKVTQLEVTQQKKYVDICKRLQRQEIIEEKWDNACRSSNKLQPLPDYNQLKQETKKLDIKVKTFYGGMLYEADDSNFPIKETKENEQNNEEGVPSVLPLLDVYSQNALRRRVLLDGLYKGARFFLDIVKYDSAILFTDLQDLVRTFKLKADNVVFKPIIWNYLGLICLRTLALKDNELKIALNKKEATELENLMLEQLPGKSDVVLNCLRIIENVDVFFEDYIMSLDV